MEGNQETALRKSELEDFSDDVLPREVSEAIDSIPDKEQAAVAKSFFMMQIRATSLNPNNAIAKKITSDHITKYLDDSATAMKEEYKERRDTKIFQGFALVVLVAFLIVVIVLLKSTPELMEKVICTVGGLLAGVLGGYGYGFKKGSEG